MWTGRQAAMEYQGQMPNDESNLRFDGFEDPRDVAQEDSFASGMLNSMHSFLTTLIKADDKKNAT